MKNSVGRPVVETTPSHTRNTHQATASESPSQRRAAATPGALRWVRGLLSVPARRGNTVTTGCHHVAATCLVSGLLLRLSAALAATAVGALKQNDQCQCGLESHGEKQQQTPTDA